MGLSTGGGGDWRSEDGLVGTVMSEINVTPFVDVMLVLLVIFMVTAPLMTQGVEVNLPRVGGQDMEQRAEQPVVLTVKADGTCYITEAGFPCAALADKLPAVFEHRADKSLFVRGDEDTPYGKLMAVLAAGRKSGVLTVGLVTDPASEEPAQ